MSSKKNKVSIKESLNKNLSFWEGMLEKSKWISGNEVGFLDFSLFGHMECIASGPTDEFIKLVREFKNIRAWLMKMTEINQKIPPLYSKRIIDYRYLIERNIKDELIFILSFTLGLIFLPVTLTLILYLFSIRTRGRHYSGAKLKDL